MKRSRLHEVLSAIIDVIWLGMLWTVCSLPVLTVGAATTALYYSVVKSVRHERGRVTAEFFRSFRQNFRQATLLWLICLGYLLLGLADMAAFARMGARPGSFWHVFSRLFLLPLPLLFPWIFAYLSRFENSVANTLRFAAYLALKHPGTSLLLLAELLAAGLLCYLMPQLILLIPGAICLLMSLRLEPVLRALGAGQGSAEDWYNE